MSLNRRNLIGAAGLGGVGLLAGPGASDAIAKETPMDNGFENPLVTGRGTLALVNANIMTLNKKQPTAEAALVRNGRITAVGKFKEISKEARGAEIFDANGATVVPGFVDHHCHVTDSCVVGDYQLQLQGLESIDQIISKLKQMARQTPKGEWIIVQPPSYGAFPDNIAEKRWIKREDLDKASDQHPIMMIMGVHVSVLNTFALKETGYWNSDTPDKAVWSDGSKRVGSFVDRGDDGVPTGIMTEMWDYRPAYTVEQYKDSLKKHFKDWFLSKGLTTMTTLPNQSPEQFSAMQQLHWEGLLPARMRVSPIVPHSVALANITKVGWRTGFGNDMLKFGGVKFFTDGINRDPFGNKIDDIKWTKEQLTETMIECQRGGLQAILHAVAPEALLLAIECIERAQQVAPAALRHRIDHYTPSDEKTLHRIKKAGITLGITGKGSPVGAAFYRAHRHKTMAEQGISILVLDAAGPGGHYHPMRGIANAMVDIDNGGSALPGETLTFEQGLRQWTIDPAHNSFEAHEKGTIEVGKFGDFAVLTANPAGKSAEEIYSIETAATIVGGNVVYRA